MEPRVGWSTGGADELIGKVQQWRDAGATHLSVDTMGSGLRDRTSMLGHFDMWSYDDVVENKDAILARPVREMIMRALGVSRIAGDTDSAARDAYHRRAFRRD